MLIYSAPSLHVLCAGTSQHKSTPLVYSAHSWAQLLMGLLSHHSLQLRDNHITTLLKNPLLSRGYESSMNWETGEGQMFEYCVYGAACSEVEIDCLTGAHKVSPNGRVFRLRSRASETPHAASP